MAAAANAVAQVDHDRLTLLILSVALCLTACRGRSRAETRTVSDATAQSHQTATTPSADVAWIPVPPNSAELAKTIRVEALDPNETPPTFVVRGAHGPHAMAFVHGLCGNAQGYLSAFPHAAARHGPVVAPQGDKPCSGAFNTWSGDLVKLDARIANGFEALGQKPHEITVIGYSLGATLALGLARKWPERYTRLVLIAAPDAPAAYGLRGVKSTVMMAGEHDRHDVMRAGMRALRNAGIPSTFMVLKGAGHGEMGPDAEFAMGEALDWLHDNQRDAAP
jgi:pimeloyl-ACP methyl ester carboxylesterase